MRTPLVLGLLVLALIPLATEQTYRPGMKPSHVAELSQEKLRSAIKSVIFIKQRNREIDSSMEAYARQRELAFTAQRNREIEVSMARSTAYRDQMFIAQRNAEINVAMAASDRLRGIEFARARNKEINVAMSMHRGMKDQLFAMLVTRSSRLLRW